MKQEQIMGIIRHALSAIGGLAVYKGWINEAASTELIGLVAMLIAVVWSVIVKR